MALDEVDLDKMTLEEVEREIEKRKDERINSPGEVGLRWKKTYGIITEEEFNKGLAEIRKNQPKDWWHAPWYKIKGMYL